MTKIPREIVELHEAAMALNEATRKHRNMSKLHHCLPKHQFITSASGEKRDPKVLNYHPTKKVKKSRKGIRIGKALSQSLVTLRNAQTRFQIAEKKVYS